MGIDELFKFEKKDLEYERGKRDGSAGVRPQVAQLKAKPSVSPDNLPLQDPKDQFFFGKIHDDAHDECTHYGALVFDSLSPQKEEPSLIDIVRKLHQKQFKEERRDPRDREIELIPRKGPNFGEPGETFRPMHFPYKEGYVAGLVTVFMPVREIALPPTMISSLLYLSNDLAWRAFEHGVSLGAEMPRESHPSQSSEKKMTLTDILKESLSVLTGIDSYAPVAMHPRQFAFGVVIGVAREKGVVLPFDKAPRDLAAFDDFMKGYRGEIFTPRLDLKEYLPMPQAATNDYINGLQVWLDAQGITVAKAERLRDPDVFATFRAALQGAVLKDLEGKAHDRESYIVYTPHRESILEKYAYNPLAKEQPSLDRKSGYELGKRARAEVAGKKARNHFP